MGGVLLALLLLIVDYFAYPYGARPGGRSFNRGENGLWLRYTWYFGQRHDAEIAALAKQLQARQIRYAYFHVRAVGKTGKLNYRFPQQAKHLIALLHQDAPDVELLAWVYVGNPRGEGEVNLADATVRRAMVSEAVWLANVCGFDGVQWDYEICDDGDADFLRLLRETRAALPPGKLLSVATPMRLPRPLQAWGWSDGYFAQVAAACDQIAVMCYDSGFWLPRSYVWLVQQQAIQVTQDVARGNPACRILLGVPTYGPGLRSHNPRAENIGLALRGVREGLTDAHAVPSVFAGVAPFADYTTDTDEWQTYADLWLTP